MRWLPPPRSPLGPLFQDQSRFQVPPSPLLPTPVRKTLAPSLPRSDPAPASSGKWPAGGISTASAPIETVKPGAVTLNDLLGMAWREGIAAHPLRSALTMLGIVFGIAAVIAMTAITEGGKEEQLAQIRRIGQNNIQVRSAELDGTRLARVRRLNPDGVNPVDVIGMHEALGHQVVATTAWKLLKAEIKHGDQAVDWARIHGVTGDFQAVLDFHVGLGRFLDPADGERRARVCVLGPDVAEALKLGPDPLNQLVVIGDEPFTVIGVMARKAFGSGGVGDLAVIDRNQDVYLPHETLRGFFRRIDRDSPYDTISLRMAGDAHLLEQSETIRRLVSELHRGADDFAVAVPLEAMRQAQRTKEVFNVIIIVIAAISLVVGGIGIMNIMLASVTERTREIGIRRAIGASRNDIMRQFLLEALLIASAGGIAGLILGLLGGLLIQALFAFTVAFNGWIMLIATVTAMGVGIGFGLYPAWKAARMDPVEALRT